MSFEEESNKIESRKWLYPKPMESMAGASFALL